MDPYYEWLGIPPDEQPPNHYRLLGISLLETNPQVIESAANQRMGYLQQLSGDQASMDDAQRIMGEISRARLVLLDNSKKVSYDREISQNHHASGENSTAIPRESTKPSTSPEADARGKEALSQNSSSAEPSPRSSIDSRNLPAKRHQDPSESDVSTLSSRVRLWVILGFSSLVVLGVIVFFLGNGTEEIATSPSGKNSSKKPVENSDSRRKTVVEQSDSEDANAIPARRPVPPLFRSPDEVAADPPPVPVATSSGAQQNSTEPNEQDSNSDDNPFVIGSKRDPTMASSIMPEGNLPIAGDIEDRVRVTIKDNEAQFTFDDEGKRRRISLVGSFNSWNSNATPMRREGKIWKTTKRLSPIQHEFKFIDGTGQWYPEGDNLILNLGGQTSAVEPAAVHDTREIKPISVPLNVIGDHQGRVSVSKIGNAIRFAFRNEPRQDYVLLLGDFNSWNATVGGMQREGENWVTTKSLPPGNYAFKFLGPDDNWYPAGDNLSISFQHTTEPIAPPNEAPQQNVQPVDPQPSALTPREPDESRETISSQRAREYLSDAGLYEGKPGVWYFPQNNRLVIRQYGRISKDPKIQKALKKLGDRLPHPAEMENPPPQRR